MRILGRSGVGFPKEEVIRALESGMEQFERILSRGSGVWVQGLDMESKGIQTRRGLLTGKGQRGYECGWRNAESFGNVRDRITSGDTSACFVFHEGREGNADFFREFSHTHTHVQTYLLDCGRKIII